MDLNRDGFLTANELQEILEQCNEKVPGFKIRQYIAEYDTDKNGALTYDEFIKVGKLCDFLVLVHLSPLLHFPLLLLLLPITIQLIHILPYLVFLPKDLEKRAGTVLQNADTLGCKAFVTPKEIVKGNSKLNMAFVANLFNHHPALDPPEDMEFEDVEETREEKTYRNWMNSLSVSPYVHHLYSDLSNGLVLLQLINNVNPGIVNWDKVNQGATLKKMGGNMKKIENCNYAVDLGREMKFSLVGIGGQDIRDGNQTLTLAIVWQLLRAYTLGILQKINDSDKPLTDPQIVEWANNKLEEAGKKSKISHFKDPSISDSKVILDLMEAIKPNCVNFDLYIDPREDPSTSEETKLKNAQYAITIARKSGAMVYALPEDIVEVNPKMVMTIFACIMALDQVLLAQNS
eukprot:XP_011669350.1 PREDICTED: fimbrin-like [Strongylocentrotus purpuratus]